MFCFIIPGFSHGFEASVLSWSNWCHCKSKAAAAHTGLPLKSLGSTWLFCWGLMLLCNLFSNESKWGLLTRSRHHPKSFWRFYVCDSIKCCVNTITCVRGNCFMVGVLTQMSLFCSAGHTPEQVSPLGLGLSLQSQWKLWEGLRHPWDLTQPIFINKSVIAKQAGQF